MGGRSLEGLGPELLSRLPAIRSSQPRGRRFGCWLFSYSTQIRPKRRVPISSS